MPSATQWTYFAVLAGTGVLFLMASIFVFLPLLILSPSKFALTFSLGSGLILSSLGALKGWRTMGAHMLSRDRLPFTAAYVGSLLGTIYAAIFMHSYLFSLLFCVAQVRADGARGKRGVSCVCAGLVRSARGPLTGRSALFGMGRGTNASGLLCSNSQTPVPIPLH